MERFVTDERAGLKYELVGDYYLIAGDDEPLWTICQSADQWRIECLSCGY